MIVLFLVLLAAVSAFSPQASLRKLKSFVDNVTDEFRQTVVQGGKQSWSFAARLNVISAGILGTQESEPLLEASLRFVGLLEFIDLNSLRGFQEGDFVVAHYPLDDGVQKPIKVEDNGTLVSTTTAVATTQRLRDKWIQDALDIARSLADKADAFAIVVKSLLANRNCGPLNLLCVTLRPQPATLPDVRELLDKQQICLRNGTTCRVPDNAKPCNSFVIFDKDCCQTCDNNVPGMPYDTVSDPARTITVSTTVTAATAVNSTSNKRQVVDPSMIKFTIDIVAPAGILRANLGLASSIAIRFFLDIRKSVPDGDDESLLTATRRLNLGKLIRFDPGDYVLSLGTTKTTPPAELLMSWEGKAQVFNCVAGTSDATDADVILYRSLLRFPDRLAGRPKTKTRTFFATVDLSECTSSPTRIVIDPNFAVVTEGDSDTEPEPSDISGEDGTAAPTMFAGREVSGPAGSGQLQLAGIIAGSVVAAVIVCVIIALFVVNRSRNAKHQAVQTGLA
jgi:hypothetical protein